MKDALCNFIQILGFAVLVGVFNLLTTDQKGERHSKHIMKGASYFKDANGIPSIEADTLQDGFFALGFLHAEDRLWQMFLGSKLARGELAEVFGEKILRFDEFARMMNLRQICESTFTTFSKEEKSTLEAYTNGVNYYIENAYLLPVEFIFLGVGKFKWTIEDSCLSIKLIEYYLSTDFLKEIVREHLLNSKVMSQEIFERLFPFDLALFESRTTIIKNNEAMHLRKNAEPKKDVEPKKVEAHKAAKPQKTEEEIRQMNEEVQKQREPKQYQAKDKPKREEKYESTEKVASNERKEPEKPKGSYTKPRAEAHKSTEKATVDKEKEPEKPKGSYAKLRAEAHHVNKEIPTKEEAIETNEDKDKPKEKKTQRVSKSTTTVNPKKEKDDDRYEIPHMKQDMHGGSNSYVFSGNITDDGQPILGNDPHLHNEMPSFWYMINMKIKTGQHYIGGTHPGSGCILIGQNKVTAWGITIGFGDIADFVKIPKTKVDSTLSFTLDKNKHFLKKRTETIYLNAKKTKSVTRDFLDSEIGPVVNGYEDSLLAIVNLVSIPHLIDNDYYYILRATFTLPYDSNFKAMTNFHMMNSFEEVQVRLAEISMSLSIIYADVKGNIGYQLTGKIPIRHKRAEGSYPTVLEHESDLKPAYIPFKELPHLINPAKGYIVTCNNLVISEDYKYILQGGFIGDQRARSIEHTIDEHLKQKKKITTQFVIEKIIGSVKDLVCKDILGKIKLIAANEKVDARIINDLKSFDCFMKGDSTEALKYNVYLNEIYNRLYYFEGQHTVYHKLAMESEHKENYLIYKLNQYASNPKLCLKEYKQSCTSFFNEVYMHMMAFIKLRLGPEKNWKWSNLNQKYYPHMPFSRIPLLDMLSSRLVKTDGNVHCPKTCGFNAHKRDYLSFLSSNLKYVTHLNKPNDFHISIDCGNDGRLFSKNYDNRCRLHEDTQLIHFDYSFKLKPTMRFLPIH